MFNQTTDIKTIFLNKKGQLQLSVLNRNNNGSNKPKNNIKTLKSGPGPIHQEPKQISHHELMILGVARSNETKFQPPLFSFKENSAYSVPSGLGTH